MSFFVTSARMAFVAVIVVIQGCSLAPKAINPVEQQLTMDRYHRCVQRFNTDASQMCDGHKRDVISTYPLHMQNHVSSLLSQKFNAQHVRPLRHTGADIDVIARKLRSAVSAKEAEEVDL